MLIASINIFGGFTVTQRILKAFRKELRVAYVWRISDSTPHCYCNPVYFQSAGLSKHETSQQGNNFGIAGMAIALIATIFDPIPATLHGSRGDDHRQAIGIRLAKRVEMTEMPGAGWRSCTASSVWRRCWWASTAICTTNPGMEPILVNIHLTEVPRGIFIGAVTFTGLIVAFGKLRGKISSKPLMLPNRHKLNLAALVVSLCAAGGLCAYRKRRSAGAGVTGDDHHCAGVRLAPVASIGGADMPVVVSMLNSYRVGGGSGWLMLTTTC